MIARATLARVVAALALLAIAACGVIDLGSHGGDPGPDGGGPGVLVPIDEAGSSDDAGLDADVQTDAKPAAIVYVKASNTQPGAEFADVAIDGDTLVVGAPKEGSGASGIDGNQTDRSAPLAGAVYVFRRSAGVWAQEAYIKASNAAENAVFGACIALQGNTLVVGAFQESSTGTDAGAAYVFTRTGTTWSEQAILRASNARSGAFFGNAVALSGDEVVIGAPGDASNATGVNGNANDTSKPDAGAAYIFKRTGTAWSQTAFLKASNTRADAAFGTTLALQNDTLVVGALRESSNATGVNGNQNDTSIKTAGAGAGAAYVFTRSAGAWSQQAYLKSSNRFPIPDLGGGFSLALALSGHTLAVGQYIEPSNATGVGGNQTNTSAANSGAVYVFTRIGTTWSQQAYLKASNTRASALFGFTLALEANTLIVGARGESSDAVGWDGNQSDTSQSGAGAAYTFARAGSTWAQTHYLKATNTRAQTAFGYSVSLSGGTFVIGSAYEGSAATGVDGDGGPDANAAPSSGAVYVFP